MRRTSADLAGVAFCLWLAGCGGGGGGNESGVVSPADARISIGNLSLMLPVLDLETPQDDIATIKNYLKAQDIFVFPPQVYLLASALKTEIPDLSIGTGGTSISSLLPGIPNIPADVGYVTYDYEPGFTPEFSADQTVSISYFQQLNQAAHAAGKRFVAGPVYVYGQTWDWGEVAKAMDVLVLQVQNFQTGANVPDALKPSALGIDLVGVTKKVVAQVRTKSPATKIYLQLDTLVTLDPNDVLSDIARVKNLGIDGFTLWYNPGLSGGTSQLGRLVQVLNGLDRN